MAWNLRAQLLETCRCNMLCPCWYGVRELMVMDRGWCTTTQWYLIENGRSAEVDLGERTVVLTMDFPGPTLFDSETAPVAFISTMAHRPSSAASWRRSSRG